MTPERAAALEVAKPAATECWDELDVLDDSRSSQGSAVLERWVCEDDGSPGSRIPVAAAYLREDELDVLDDIRSSQGSVLPVRCVCGIDCNPGSRIPVAAADPSEAVWEEPGDLELAEPAELAELDAAWVEPLRN